MGVRKKWFLSSQQWLWFLSTLVTTVLPSLLVYVLIQLLYRSKGYSNRFFWIITLPLLVGLLVAYTLTGNLYLIKSSAAILVCLLIYNYQGVKKLTLAQKRFLAIFLFGSILLEAIVSGFTGRFNGIIRGYDIIVLYFVVLVINDNNLRPWVKFALSPILLLSGRFGFMVVVLFLFIKYSRKYLLYLPLVASLSFISPYIQFKANEYLVTMQGVFQYLTSGQSDVFDSYNRDDYVDGYFGSPMVLINEYKNVYQDLSLWPSEEYIFYDSGPSYVFANMGLLLGVLYYALFFMIIYRLSPGIMVMMLFIIVDFKFHLTFVPYTLYFLKMLYDKENTNLLSYR